MEKSMLEVTLLTASIILEVQEGIEVTSIKKKKLQRYKMTIGKKWIEMTKKLPNGHNIGGTAKQKRRKEHKQESNKN